MTDKPPTRYTEEGISLPERGSGYRGDTPSSPSGGADDPKEPESLTIPAHAVAQLIEWALQTQPGAAWFNGWVLGKGEPPWIINRQWALMANECKIVRAERQPGPQGQPTNGQMR